jgi:hypothetical protein
VSRLILIFNIFSKIRNTVSSEFAVTNFRSTGAINEERHIAASSHPHRLSSTNLYSKSTQKRGATQTATTRFWANSATVCSSRYPASSNQSLLHFPAMPYATPLPALPVQVGGIYTLRPFRTCELQDIDNNLDISAWGHRVLVLEELLDDACSLRIMTVSNVP